MQFRLRTLLFVLAVGPVVLDLGWWTYSAWRVKLERQGLLLKVPDGGTVLLSTEDIAASP